MNRRTLILAAAILGVTGVSQAAPPAPFDYSYEGNALPDNVATNPFWASQETAGSSASVSGGVLTITTNTIPDYHEYYITGGSGSAWNPTAVGTTVEVKLDVVSNPDIDWANNLNINTGIYNYNILLGTNYITVIGGGDFPVVNDNVFHTYRFTTDDTAGKLTLYMDGATTPAKVWTVPQPTPEDVRNYISFGDNSAGNLDGTVQWDYIRWTNTGAFAPIDQGWRVNASGDWNQASNWAGSVPNAVDASAKFLGAISSARTVYSDTAVTIGALTFDSASTYQIAGNGSLSIDVSTGNGSITVAQGTHKINLPLFINDNTTADIAAGATLKISDPMTLVGGSTLTKIGDGVLSIEAPVSNAAPAALALAGGTTNALMDLTSTMSVNVSGGTTNLKATQHLAALNVSGGTVNVGPGTSVVVSTKSLSISGTGQVDLQNGKMIVDYDGASVLPSVKTAINAGSLTSSQLIAGRAIGYGEASDLFAGPTGSFAGETVDSTSVVMAYTVIADASLDGTVSSSDFNQFVAGYGTLANARWTQGDFDGDGKVTTTDFNLLAGNFGNSLPASASLGSVVPEPATGALLAGLLLGLRRRRN